MKKDLEVIAGQGIKVRIDGGCYQPLHIVPGHPAGYWDPEYRVPLLREELKGVFPEVTRNGDSVVFRVLDEKQRDILSHSRQATKIPVHEQRKLQEAIDKLHSRADDPDTAITEDRRQFYRNFRLPDPAVMPECWRITGRFFQKRLHVLWGFENAKRTESTFLPQSKNARLHADNAEWANTKRQGIPDAIRRRGGGWLGWLLALLKFLCILLLLAVLAWFFLKGKGCSNLQGPEEPPPVVDVSSATSPESPTPPAGGEPMPVEQDDTLDELLGGLDPYEPPEDANVADSEIAGDEESHPENDGDVGSESHAVIPVQSGDAEPGTMDVPSFPLVTPETDAFDEPVAADDGKAGLSGEILSAGDDAAGDGGARDNFWDGGEGAGYGEGGGRGIEGDAGGGSAGVVEEGEPLKESELSADSAAGDANGGFPTIEEPAAVAEPTVEDDFEQPAYPNGEEVGDEFDDIEETETTEESETGEEPELPAYPDDAEEVEGAKALEAAEEPEAGEETESLADSAGEEELEEPEGIEEATVEEDAGTAEKPGGGQKAASEKMPNAEAAKNGEAVSQTESTPSQESESPKATQSPSPVAYAYTFQITAKKVGDDSGNAFMEFTVVSTASVRGRAVEVSDWSINQKIVKPGVNSQYKARLKYNRNYTISATVKVDGVSQKVRPYQWNMTDDPTWQIVLRGHGRKDEAKELYELLCCNSSSIKPRVLQWTPEFSDADGKLAFDVKSEPTGATTFEMAQNIGFKRGVYRLQLTADIAYEDTARGVTGRTAHCESIPFVHDTSTEGLNTAKYQVAIPHVYFCLARQKGGGEHNGTAFAVSKKRLLTNYHVAVGGLPDHDAGGADYRVEEVLQLTNWRGKTYHAKVEKADPARDLALLVLCDRNGADTGDELPGYLHLAPDSMLQTIEKKARTAFSVGYPAGTVPLGPPAYSDGKVEKLDYHREGAEGIETLVNYTDIKPGYSGGPLIDYQTGQILGVNFGGEISGGTAFGKPASMATSVREVRKCFPVLQGKGKSMGASVR